MNYKKIFIIFVTLAVLGIASGIIYLSVVRPGSVEIPNDVVMETAFGGQYDFGNMPEKVRLIEFMYINCPDVCPVTTVRMNQVRKMLEEQGVFGDKVEFLTVTIDPERDTQEKLQDYAKLFDITDDNSGWYFLRGSLEDTKKLSDPFLFMFRDPGTGYLIHSNFSYLLNTKNKQIESFTMGEGFTTERVYERIMNELN
ncbi:SCO family protein [Calidifontibacillus oryziterrae]|uniref:SCO family protein n=1 Tax=Calidifontibacillus oryziterrae TaxID=1191699 RepID=UPI0003057FF6|nr:SCO family protein [Calidifontibacillus oryziterrae]